MSSTRGKRTAALVLVAASIAMGWGDGDTAEAARRRRIDVFPGKNAIGRAIRAASPGDVLRIHPGRYPEVVEIDKRLTLRGVGKRLPTIDGRCRTGIVVDVRADGVRLKRLRVQGASGEAGALSTEVNFAFVTNGVARRMVFRDTCDAEYGVNVYRTGRVVVARSRARGFADAGLYVGDTLEGPVFFRRNEAFDNNRGIIVEDSLPGTVVVSGNVVYGNDQPGTGPEPSGIDVIRTDGALIVRNVVRDNLVYGIRAYAQPQNVSEGNRFFDNVVSGSGTYDVYDETVTQNCWNGTTYGTASPDPPPQCP